MENRVMIEYIEVRTYEDRVAQLIAVRNVPAPRCDHVGHLELVCEGARCVSCGERLTERQVDLLIEMAR